MNCTIFRKMINSHTKLHVAEHYKATKFQCKSCSKNYEFKSLLRQHEKIIHKQELLQCDNESCSKKYKSRSSLTYLREIFHKIKVGSTFSTKSWFCNQCCKSFFSSSDLKRHQTFYCKDEKDMEINMFICILCHPIKRFKCKQYYREHRAQYHNNSLSKYTCPKCHCQFKLRHAYNYPIKRDVLQRI